MTSCVSSSTLQSRPPGCLQNIVYCSEGTWHGCRLLDPEAPSLGSSPGSPQAWPLSGAGRHRSAPFNSNS
ncbi:hypothetical protein F751_1534 [Auxenochlorella protothecoides]|uniref:Uncharacterized protein n=1 Tax=Auxenochlorella protothecoides TaxID=3075 RepID=A0A087SRA1_AUXPR|nr:hypothetical protein F751_1534 [Auxenochlorella protothecoides]KFM28255.1 hypothetical protein F751_1534 [Auxenochlorella protothecoides]